MKRIAIISCVVAMGGITAFAQTTAPLPETEDNGFLINLIQNQISAPGRIINISGVEGALSSEARIGQVVISDEEGPWLEINNVEIDWNRLALLLGRLNVERFAIESVNVLRKPIPVPGPPVPEVDPSPFSLPDLPVSIDVKSVEAGTISIAEALFGQAADLGVSGSFQLASGVLDSSLEVTRQDGPGGLLDLEAAFSNESRQLGLDLTFQEPQGGIVADLLNIEGEPAMDIRLNGEGPLDEVDINFSMDAAGERIAGGLLALRGSDAGLGFDLDLKGGISPLIPLNYRDFFAGETAITANGLSKSDGGVRINSMGIKGAALDLSGRVETGDRKNLTSLNLSGTLGDPAAAAVVLPVPGGATTLNSATLFVNYGDASRWNGFVVLDRLEAGGISFEDITVDLGGLAQNLEDPATRNVTVTVEALATGLGSADPKIAAALPSRLDLFADVALPPGGPVDIRQFQASGDGLSLFIAGLFDELEFDGRTAAQVPDLSLLSGFAGRPIAGAVSLKASGQVSPLSGGLDLTFDGIANNMSLGDTRLDRLLAGDTTLGGRAVRDENGVRTENLRIENPQLLVSTDGQISTAGGDIGFAATLYDLALVDPNLTGTFEATGRAQGSGGPLDVSVKAGVKEGSIAGQAVSGLSVGFDGQVDGTAVSGALDGSGTLGALGFELSGDVAATPKDQSIRDLKLALGETAITGSLTRTKDAPITGNINVIAPDLEPLANLASVDATGMIDAAIALGSGDVGQRIGIEATTTNLSFAGSSVGNLVADLAIDDAFGVPMLDGTITASEIFAGGLDVSSLSVTANRSGPDTMEFELDSRLAIGTLTDLSGELQRQPEGFAATLKTLRIRQDTAEASLAAPTTVTVAGQNITITPLAMNIGDGGLTAEGNIGETIDLAVNLDNLPLDVANTIKPALGLQGALDGTVNVTGSRAAPDITFDVTGRDLGAAATVGAGLPLLALNATGRTANGTVTLDAGISASDGLAVDLSGQVPLGEGALDLALNLKEFDLGYIDGLAGNRDLSGTVSGDAKVGGTLSDPSVEFNVNGQSINARLLRDNGIGALGFDMAGAYAENTVSLNTAKVSGALGLAINATGKIPLSGDGLSVSVDGQVPLELANTILAGRAAQANGKVSINASASGSLAAPVLAGNVSLQGGTFTDPQANMRFENIVLDAALNGKSIDVRKLTAQVAAGGSISGGGSIAVNPAAGFPADITLKFNDVRYTDGAFATTRFSGNLGLSGPVLGGGLLSGKIDLGKTEISIAEGLGSAGSGILDQVQHLRPPPRVLATLKRADSGVEAEPESQGDSNVGKLRLDIKLNAPNQIFVRGRGLDAELGGALRIGGTVGDIQPIGEFELRRGRIVILAQRIEFTEGALTLEGNLDPKILFVAETRAGDVTARVTVSGRVSDPQIDFSSTPALPQDEVLAQLLFGRSAADLTAFQLAQLAAAAAELAGVGGSGLMTQLREATGLDNLDVLTDESGATAVRAGKYIDDNLYLDVQTDSDGVSQVGIVYDLNDKVTARGSVGSDGNSLFGLFYERDF